VQFPAARTMWRLSGIGNPHSKTMSVTVTGALNRRPEIVRAKLAGPGLAMWIEVDSESPGLGCRPSDSGTLKAGLDALMKVSAPSGAIGGPWCRHRV